MDKLQPEQGWISQPAFFKASDLSQQGRLFNTVGKFAKYFDKQQIPQIFSALHLHKRLFWAWLGFASQLFPYGKLDGQTREKLILRTAWNCRCRYEWGQHVIMGLRAGLATQDIVNTTHSPEQLAQHSPDDALLMQVCDALCSEHVIQQPMWHSLTQRFSQAECIEMSLLIGHYIMLAGFLNSVGLCLEDENEHKLQLFFATLTPHA